ncbi:hypothetical protein SLE2022_143970 [Rubroshorea leprosula]
MVWLRISGVPLKAWSDQCFERMATSLREVVMVHEDTKSKSILCNGRILILCSKIHKISKTLKLKVEEMMYEVEVMEKKWRADPDWCLANDDRQGEIETESEYSSSKNGDNEDHELNSSEIHGDDEEEIDEERL